jgi:ectoine hydroxylase-related dioxygenase (phytanoyl-CoA dioxygenase family)
MFEEEKARYVELEPGQISLHDVHLLHGSEANQSSDRRAGFVIRYMPSTAVLRRDLDMSEVSKLDWTEMPLLLVRGQNRQADNDLEIGHRSGSVR